MRKKKHPQDSISTHRPHIYPFSHLDNQSWSDPGSIQNVLSHKPQMWQNLTLNRQIIYWWGRGRLSRKGAGKKNNNVNCHTTSIWKKLPLLLKMEKDWITCGLKKIQHRVQIVFFNVAWKMLACCTEVMVHSDCTTGINLAPMRWLPFLAKSTGAILRLKSVWPNLQFQQVAERQCLPTHKSYHLSGRSLWPWSPMTPWIWPQKKLHFLLVVVSGGQKFPNFWDRLGC